MGLGNSTDGGFYLLLDAGEIVGIDDEESWLHVAGMPPKTANILEIFRDTLLHRLFQVFLA